MDAKIEKQIMYNVLKCIKNGNKEEYKVVPSQEYLVALKNIGFIKMGWDNELTDFGDFIFNKLENELLEW